MATYQFKLPDIGEGIAEAEVVAWHVKLGDRVEEDQQLADMMTDKATVEMESPVAGTVTKLAGDVGDLIAIGSVLVEIETDAEVSAVESKEEQPLGDGAVVATATQTEKMPTAATAELPLPQASSSAGLSPGHAKERSNWDEPRSGERGGPAEQAAPTSKETSPPPAPPASGRG